MEHALTRLRRLSGDFFGWWFGELRALVPPRLLRRLLPPRDEVIVEPSGSRLVLRRIGAGGERELGFLPVDADPEQARAALRTLLAGVDLGTMPVSLRMPPSVALRKIVELPDAAEENLRQVMTFEMDRLTPFSPDTVHFQVRIVGRDDEARRIRVELMVVPHAAVEPALAVVRRLGLEPDAIAVPRAAAAGDAPPWRVPLGGNGSGRRRRIGRLTTALLALAAVLFAAGLVVRFEAQRARALELQEAVAAARKDADEGRRLQEEIERVGKEGRFIVDRKLERPLVVDVLDELTRALPDDTWLYRVRLTSDELQTFGYSPNASAMIGQIESSQLFGGAQFRAPLTRDPRVEAEQFHVAFRVAREETP